MICLHSGLQPCTWFSFQPHWLHLEQDRRNKLVNSEEEISRKSCCSVWTEWKPCTMIDNDCDSVLLQIFKRANCQTTISLSSDRATWHRMIKSRQFEDIYIQRRLSPQLRKRGGQLSSSTSIHYASIKKKDKDRLTHWHPYCHTGKPCSG